MAEKKDENKECGEVDTKNQRKDAMNRTEEEQSEEQHLDVQADNEEEGRGGNAQEFKTPPRSYGMRGRVSFAMSIYVSHFS